MLGSGWVSRVLLASACCKWSSRSSSDSSRASGGSFGTSPVSSSAMSLPCASPLPKTHGASQGRWTWRKAAPPRRRPFMNRSLDSQPQQRAVRAAAVKREVIVLAAVALTAAAGGAHKVVRKTAALDFSYAWPAEAVAIPALDMRFYKDARAKLAEAQKNAAE